MNINKVIKVELTVDELSYIRRAHDIVDEICDAAEGVCDICPLKECCSGRENLRVRLSKMYLELKPEEKS